MLRPNVILVLWLLTQVSFGQSVEDGAGQAAYDTICSIYNRMKEQESLHRDSTLHERLSTSINPAKEWAREYGTQKDQAQCALIHWRHLEWSRSSDTYSRILIAREIWNHRTQIDRGDLVSVLGHLSSFYQQTKRPEERLKIMLEVCKLNSENDSLFYCGELAGVYHDLGQYQRAIEFYKGDVVQAEEAKKWFKVSALYNNIGLAYRDIGKKDSAELFFTASLDLLSNQKLMTEVKPFYLKHFTSVVRWNLEHLVQKDITPEKLRLARDLIYSGSKVPEYQWVLKGHEFFARYYYDKREFATAELHADSALQLANKTKHMDALVTASQLKGKALLAQDRFDESDELFERSIFIADSVRLAEAALDASIAAAQFEAKEREQELQDSQEKTKLAQLQAESEHRQRLWFTALFAGAVLVLILVGFLLYSSMKNRKLIADQKVQLEGSLAEKEVLLKEIHHRVKNNLQVISSLLDLQSNRLTDEASQNAFQEGQNRVKSIALIHQQLYQNDELAGVEFCTFSEALFNQVRAAMIQRGQSVQLELKAPTTNFDIDTAVPLGLILNEMLTNSFKHAVSGSAESTFVIELLNPSEGSFELKYSDGGHGIPKDIDMKKVRSLGLRLIYRLTRQLGGTIETNTSDGNLFTIKFLDTEVRKGQN